MKIYDTLSDTEIILNQKKVRIYLCGVTVYDESHIGHARTIIVFDVLRRYLEFKGVQVVMIQNFTDVDDKIIARATTEKTSAKEISTRYINQYFDAADKLNINRATLYPKATEHISDIIQFIDKLVQNNIAYVSENGIYFAVSKFSEYGKLSKKKIDELKVGARIHVDESKQNPLDFAVWKFTNIEPCWQSPWGKGRPGWHIECSAMSAKYLGDSFDIHGGGRDLIFPHHENEIAQSESCSNTVMAKVWLHVGMVTIQGTKMSKSLGNIRSISQAIIDWGPNIIRLFCLSGHYAKPIDYTQELLRESLTKWRQIETCYYTMIHLLDDNTNDIVKKDIVKDTTKSITNDITKKITELYYKFDAALESDLNTHLAISALFDLVKEINRLGAANMLTNSAAKTIMPKFQTMINILGLKLDTITVEQKKEINTLLAKREELRKATKFTAADHIRQTIIDMGIEIMDQGGRTIWVKREEIRME